MRGLITITMLCALSVGVAKASPPASRAEVQAEIWAKEQAIYAGRGRGDLGPYIESVAPDFLSWPPQAPAPVDLAALKASAPSVAGGKEHLSMSFVALSLYGDTAVIYYRTHMTQRADGTPVDQSYEVTHTWVSTADGWRLFGGMARPAAGR